MSVRCEIEYGGCGWGRGTGFRAHPERIVADAEWAGEPRVIGRPDRVGAGLIFDLGYLNADRTHRPYCHWPKTP